MNRSIKYIILGSIIIVLGILCFSYFSPPPIYCDENLNGKSTMKEVVSTYGYPDYTDTILLSHDSSLYEYQSGLYNFMPSKGSYKKIVVLTFKKHNNHIMKIWYEPADDKTINILDNLEWNPDKVQF